MQIRKWLPFVTTPEVELKANRIQTATVYRSCTVRDYRTRACDERIGWLCYECYRNHIQDVLDSDALGVAEYPRIRSIQEEELPVWTGPDYKW